MSPPCTQATRSHRVRRDSNPHLPAVEKVGIEPTTSTLARRDRSLSCHPHVPRLCGVGAWPAYYRPGGEPYTTAALYPLSYSPHEPVPAAAERARPGTGLTRGLSAALGISHCGVSKVQADSPRRVPLRWAGRARTPIRGFGDRCSAVELRPIRYFGHDKKKPPAR